MDQKESEIKCVSDVILENNRKEIARKDVPVVASTGFVAFLDVLGWQNIISNNKVATSVSIVRDVFEQAANDIKSQRNLMRYIHPSFLPSHFIFSDSILIYMELGDSSMPKISKTFFLGHCCEVIGRLCAKGLPVRGAIAYGEYFIGGGCLVGKPITESHQCGERLDLAGCALTATGADKLLDADDFTKYVIDFKAPVKDSPCNQSSRKQSSRKQFKMLNFLESLERDTPFSRETIVACFQSHGKTLRKGTKPWRKMENTIEFLEKCSQLRKT